MVFLNKKIVSLTMVFSLLVSLFPILPMIDFGSSSSSIAYADTAARSTSTATSFKDLSSVPWAVTAINYLAAKGIVKGDSGNLYRPDRPVTRAEFASLLVRTLIKDKPTSVKPAPFVDVKAGDWFAKDVAIAYQYEIVKGATATKFAPMSTITREEMAAMIARALKFLDNKEASNVDSILKIYRDRTTFSPWAKEGIALVTELNIMKGVGANTFSAKEKSTRAMAAVVMYKLYTRNDIKVPGFHYKDKVLVLTYHHLDYLTNGMTITPEQFESQMKTLKENHYNVISMDQFIKFLDKQGEVPENAVLLTFDDGYESFYTMASPILEKYQFVATNFIIVSSTVMQNTLIPHLSWDQMKELKEKGMSFYSHTYNQHQIVTINRQGDQGYKLVNPMYNLILGLESEEEYKQRVTKDLLKADELIQKHLGNQEKMLCFPYGAYNQTVIDIAKSEGIRYFFTINEGINTPGMSNLTRLNAGSPEVTSQLLLSNMETYDEQ